MKPILFFLLLSLIGLLAFHRPDSINPKISTTEAIIKKDSILRHVVMFKFKDHTAVADIKKVEDAFSALPSKISVIKKFEFGINNSPEGLNQGFTHCFFLSFASENDRAIYLPHPAHKAFGELLSPFLDKVCVVDYWVKQ